jgi:hypothetical protein
MTPNRKAKQRAKRHEYYLSRRATMTPQQLAAESGIPARVRAQAAGNHDARRTGVSKGAPGRIRAQAEGGQDSRATGGAERVSARISAQAAGGHDAQKKLDAQGHASASTTATHGESRIAKRRRLFLSPSFGECAIAASCVGSYPCAARRILPLWPLAHIQGRSCGAAGDRKIRPTMTPSSSTL